MKDLFLGIGNYYQRRLLKKNNCVNNYILFEGPAGCHVIMSVVKWVGAGGQRGALEPLAGLPYHPK